MSTSVCLLLLGSFGFVAALQYWDQGLTLPSGCFLGNRSEERCEETLRNSDVYNVLEEFYERSPAGRENFRDKVRSCAEKMMMLPIDFLYLCDSMKFVISPELHVAFWPTKVEFELQVVHGCEQVPKSSSSKGSPSELQVP
ncbi:hypothetical protein HPB50_005900 [Hyalomma asiaticum]|uniref:Uncharacterized protein n=1 Tax=Hyalomma asiaticum TaxID=266040 RepID=A0ACB7T657_HYAAI|nr:hypothetical protein HPB50_005900 [Hyalomma asiaticum]